MKDEKKAIVLKILLIVNILIEVFVIVIVWRGVIYAIILPENYDELGIKLLAISGMCVLIPNVIITLLTLYFLKRVNKKLNVLSEIEEK